LREEIATLL